MRIRLSAMLCLFLGTSFLTSCGPSQEERNEAINTHNRILDNLDGVVMRIQDVADHIGKYVVAKSEGGSGTTVDQINKRVEMFNEAAEKAKSEIGSMDEIDDEIKLKAAALKSIDDLQNLMNTDVADLISDLDNISFEEESDIEAFLARMEAIVEKTEKAEKPFHKMRDKFIEKYD